MQTLSTPEAARQFVWSLRAAGKSVGVVPTMGALHEGHLSLVRLSRQQCDETIATIFVNPTQFGPEEDLQKYPRDLGRDLQLLADQDVAAVFVPSAETMYPEGFSTFVHPPEVALPLEGVCRPDHFRGVTTVVLKLFQAIPATHAFFGKKDYQQLKVIQAMTRDLDVGIEIVAGDIIRQPDGLALSSRNSYLSAEDRRRALRLSQSLNLVSELAAAGERDVEALQNAMRQRLISDSGVDRIDYAVVVDAESLAPLSTLNRAAVALIAARVGKTRLIDNLSIEVQA